MNRREFFHPQSLWRSAGEVFGLLNQFRDPLPGADLLETTLLRHSRQAMAAIFEVLLPFGTARATEASENALDLVDRLEGQMTVYRQDSEISRLNRSAAQAATVVEEKLFGLLALAKRLHQELEGAFDISLGALIKTWGFFRRQGRVPSPEELAEVMNRVGMSHLTFDPEKRTVFSKRPGLEINLGSIGKGYALDRMAESLGKDWKITSAVLHGGHSSVRAMGTQPCEPRGWPVGLSHPVSGEKRLGVIWLNNRALGTSAATFQKLEYNGRTLGHILDPRSGWPAEGMIHVSVTAPTAALADALATAFYVLGIDKTRAFCSENPQIGAVLLAEGMDRPEILGQAREEMVPAD